MMEMDSPKFVPYNRTPALPIGIPNLKLQTTVLCTPTAVSSAGHPSSEWKGTEFQLYFAFSPSHHTFAKFHPAEKCPLNSPFFVDSIPAVWYG